jgi:hypothetical protein
MTKIDNLQLRIYWRRRLAESVAEILAYRTARMPEEFFSGISVRGYYPTLTVHLSDSVTDKIKKYGICMEPYFDEPYLTAVRKNFDN